MLRPRPPALLAAAAVVTVAATLPGAAAAPTAAANPAVTRSVATTARQVTLVTGDVVTVQTSANGRQQASIARHARRGPGGQFQTFNLGSDMYVVPQSAVPYLGSTLDLGLFDVTRLAQGASSDVQVTFRSARAPSAVPGVTITRRSGVQAVGAVQRNGGFSAALARQWTADHASKTHTTGLFAAVARIALAGARQPAVRPDYPMYTLTLHGLDATGAADSGDGALIFNVDDLRRYSGFPTFVNGIAKVSVPEGHYAALASFYDFSTDTVREVITAQFTVQGNSAITLDARRATAAVSIATPRPAVPQITDVGVGRSDARGLTASYSFLGSGDTAFRVQPSTTRMSIGQLYFYVYSRQFAADNSYSYDLKFPSDGAISGDQHYVARANDLAAIASSYPATHPDQAALDTRFGALPWELFLFAADLQFTTPVQRTEYYTALPSLSWQGVYFSVFDPDSFNLLGVLQSAWRTYPVGVHYATTWGGTPAPPRLLQAPIFVGETVCPACISGHRLYLLGYPFSDNSPEHFGFPDGRVAGLSESVRYGVYGDDVLVQHGSFLDTVVTMPVAARSYRIDLDTVRESSDFTLSTSVQTRWTVPAAVSTTALPDGWVCTYRPSVPASCGVLPLITDSYRLPVDLLGQLPPGARQAQLALSHLGGSDVAFGSVQVTVSYNSGQSWQPVAVTAEGAGGYALAFTVPTHTDGYGALHVMVRDAAGGTFEQTVQHAFAVSAS